MGSNPEANLAYGYDLGDTEDFKCAERSEYGSPDPDWYNDEADGDFPAQAYDRLYAAIESPPPAEYDWQRQKAAIAHYGVEFNFAGTDDISGWLLVAVDSTHSVEWSETMPLDLAAMAEQPAADGWDGKLAAALAALGLTPKQAGPQWLVFPFYG